MKKDKTDLYPYDNQEPHSKETKKFISRLIIQYENSWMEINIT